MFCCLAFSQQKLNFEFKSGDLLFQDLDCGGLCDAIEAVTVGVNGKNFSHIGLVYVKQDSVFVIEAIGKDVHLTPIDTFIYRNTDSAGHPKIVIARLRKNYQYLNNKAISFALHQLGTPYDDAFIYNNGKYYCSELIYDAYKYANKGKAFFSLQPMTFKNPSTGKTFDAWKKYYALLHTKIPEGKPGCNPGSISRSNKIEIISSLY